MQMSDVRVNQNLPPHQNWGPPPQGFPAPAGGGGGGGPAFAPNHQYMPPSHHYDSYYPPTELPPMDKHLHQGPPPAYARDASMGIHSSSAQPQQSVVTKVSSFAQLENACSHRDSYSLSKPFVLSQVHVIFSVLCRSHSTCRFLLHMQMLL